MKPLEYLRLLRQRWWVLPITALVGFAVAFTTQPSQPSAPNVKAAPASFEASHCLITDPITERKNQDVDWDRIALLATSGDVPNLVARRLRNYRVAGAAPAVDANGAKHGRRRGQPRAVALRFGTVTARPDVATGSLCISAVAASPTTAAKVANTFAQELLVFLNTNGSARYIAEVAQLSAQRSAAEVQLAATDYLGAQPGIEPFTRLSNENKRTALETRIGELSAQIVDAAPEGAGLRSLEKASPWTAIRTAGAAPPNAILSSVESGPQRLLVGGAVGLLIGVAGLLVLELLSSRVRDVAGTESATRLPVITEIPEVKLTRAEWFRVLTAEEPSGLVAEAYRSLRTSMLAMWQRHPVHKAAATAPSGGGVTAPSGGDATPATGRAVSTSAVPPLRTLLVTSASAAEGKSVSAVNLAAAFAETGSTVIVLDADFRRPQLDRYFSRPTTPNLGDLIPLHDDVTADQLEEILQESGIPGVRFAASAPPKSQPAGAMTAAKAAARVATELADIVILDSPPLLLANDAADLSSVADATVMMVRSGWTRRAAAGRAADLLRRLEATVIGTALVGVQHSARTGYYGYYGYYGYGYDKPEQAQLRNRLLPWKRSHTAPRTKPADVESISGLTGGTPTDHPKPWN
ncbi:MAG TPA: hypothetical protein VFF40_04850 [Acidimicrobiia bacterium]|nr:hypothetical protein [Acidimicrobiia bacterium]